MLAYVERQAEILKKSRVEVEEGNGYNGLRKLIIKRNLAITEAIAALKCRCRQCNSAAEEAINEYLAVLAEKYPSSTTPEEDLIAEMLKNGLTSPVRLTPNRNGQELSERVATYTAPNSDDRTPIK